MQQLFLRKKLSVDHPYQGVKGNLGIVGKGAQGVKCLTNALPDILHDGRVKAPAHIPHGAQEGTNQRKQQVRKGEQQENRTLGFRQKRGKKEGKQGKNRGQGSDHIGEDHIFGKRTDGVLFPVLPEGQVEEGEGKGLKVAPEPTVLTVKEGKGGGGRRIGERHFGKVAATQSGAFQKVVAENSSLGKLSVHNLIENPYIKNAFSAKGSSAENALVKIKNGVLIAVNSSPSGIESRKGRASGRIDTGDHAGL